MKNTFIITLLLSVFALTACDNTEQKRRQACTEAYNTINDILIARPGVDKSKYDSEKKTWDDLQCHRSDVITH
jgi:hypothetical protein